MPMQLSLTNVLKLTGYITPFLISFFLIMSSVINTDAKALVYLAGALITLFINKVFFMNIFKSNVHEERSDSCNLFNWGTADIYDSPAFNSVFLGFTMAYLIIPMFNIDKFNIPLVAFLLFMFGLDAMTKVLDKCTTISGVILGMLIGALFGWLWYVVFETMGGKQFLYFSEVTSRGDVCTRPTKQTFKCKAYNSAGELLGNL